MNIPKGTQPIVCDFCEEESSPINHENLERENKTVKRYVFTGDQPPVDICVECLLENIKDDLNLAKGEIEEILFDIYHRGINKND